LWRWCTWCNDDVRPTCSEVAPRCRDLLPQHGCAERALREQLNDNAEVYEQIADLLEKDQFAEIDLDDRP
jgi:hypothetical protein